MIPRIIAGVNRALGRHRPGRNLLVYPDDVFILSYPKSGNTWTRFLIANLLHPETPATFSNINDLAPDPEACSVRELSRIPRPRILKSHQYFDPRYPRVIYIVRDPRDVALSQFHFQIKRKVLADDYPLESFIGAFIAGAASPYGSWAENVSSWLAPRYGQSNFLLVRYEDLIGDAIREMARVAAFLHIPANELLLAQAVERSSADNMRKLEAEQGHLWTTTQQTRKDIPFVRSATAGGWKAKMPERAAQQIEKAWSPLMKWLGYELCSAGHSEISAGFPEAVLHGSRE